MFPNQRRPPENPTPPDGPIPPIEPADPPATVPSQELTHAEAVAEEKAEKIVGLSEGHENIPVNPWRRHAAIAAAVVFILAIVIFLVWFIATNTETGEPPSLFGAALWLG
jgi:hypothetical protein